MLFGEAVDGKFRVRDENGAVGDPSEAVFPIFAAERTGRLRAVGTGFFITNPCVFATAAHVVDEALDSKGSVARSLFMGHLLPAGKIQFRRIVQCTSHLIADVAIGVVEPMAHRVSGDHLGNKFFPLANRPSFPGEIALTYAFPKTIVGDEEKQDIDMEPGFFEGRTVEYFPNGRDSVLMRGPCYRTSIALHGGASGGPVFNSDGRVFAINSTGYDDESLSFVSCVSSLGDLYLSGMRLEGESTPRVMTFREMVASKVVAVE